MQSQFTKFKLQSGCTGLRVQLVVSTDEREDLVRAFLHHNVIWHGYDLRVIKITDLWTANGVVVEVQNADVDRVQEAIRARLRVVADDLAEFYRAEGNAARRIDDRIEERNWRARMRVSLYGSLKPLLRYRKLGSKQGKCGTNIEMV